HWPDHAGRGGERAHPGPRTSDSEGQGNRARVVAASVRRRLPKPRAFGACQGHPPGDQPGSRNAEEARDAVRRIKTASQRSARESTLEGPRGRTQEESTQERTQRGSRKQGREGQGRRQVDKQTDHQKETEIIE